MLKSVELAVSNIAFPAGELDAGVHSLLGLKVRALELAPYNVFGRWDVPRLEIQELRGRLDDKGVRCHALQGILFKAGAVHLFASAERRDLLFRHLTKIAEMAGLLGAGACVFGAPLLRDPGDIEPAHAWAIAVEFLRRLGPIFASEGTVLSFEPNSPRYSCRFITNTTEAIELVRDVDVVGVGLQIDTGTAFLEKETPGVLADAVPYTVHAHISEPDLVPPGSSGLDHRPYSEALRKAGYKGTLSIEMKQTDDWQGALRRSVAFAREAYWP